MNEVEQIYHQLKSTFDGDSWHGPSFMDVLKEVDVADVKDRPLGERHTIWEIVNHCSFWMKTVRDVLEGAEHPKLGEKVDDWPPMGEGRATWSDALKNIKSVEEALVGAIAYLSVQLDENVPGTSFSYSHMLYGTVHHNLYHAGQIAILKRKK